MDSNRALSTFLSSGIILTNRAVHLVTSPYRSMRSIAKEQDILQLAILHSTIFLYFALSLAIRRKIYLLSATLASFLLLFWATVLYFYIFSQFLKKEQLSLKRFIFTFSYGLLPTLIWFIFDFILYLTLPPPRTLSIAGKTFSLVYIAISMSIFLWKIILFYLAVRFASRLTFFSIVYQIILYLCLLLPGTILLYRLGIFRIPFI